jgi:large subunit ribosomal protein L23
MKRTLRDPRDVIIEPVVSEKSYDLIDDANTYTFVVDRGANKTQIKQAVITLFNVQVVSVNTMNRKGKIKRTGYVLGKRKDTKRALVKLADGDSIDFFEV